MLLKNTSNLLPLKPSELKSIAVIGPNADAPVFSGGGSANLRPYKHTTTLEGIRGVLSASGHNTKVHHVIGAHAHKASPLLGEKQLKTKDGRPGFNIEWFREDPVKNPNTKAIHFMHATHSWMWFVDNIPEVRKYTLIHPVCVAVELMSYFAK